MEVEKTLKEALDSIRYFKSLSNENDIIEFANNKLDLIYPFASPVKPDFSIYRTRPKSNIKEDDNMSSSSTFSYVPLELNSKKIPSLGRFNLDGQSIFYASISGSTNLKEMKDSIKEGDVVYISKWVFKEDAEIRLYYIYPPEHLKPKSLQDSLLANVVDNHKVDPIIGDFLKELGYMLLDKKSSDDTYLKTALIANKIYEFDYHGISYDAILYPSVQGHEYDFNLAIKPQYVDKNLVLQYVYEAIVKDNRVEINCSHVGINNVNQIQWYELYIYEDNISLNSFSFLDDNKVNLVQGEILYLYYENNQYTISQFGQLLISKLGGLIEQLRKINFFKDKFTLEDNMNDICGKRCKYCDIKVNNMYYYISDIRYEVAYIRVWINYINSLKPLGEVENSSNS